MGHERKALCGTSTEKAARLEQLIEAAIAERTFLPRHGYLQAHPVFGACGCAIAAAATVTGMKPPSDPDVIQFGPNTIHRHLAEVGVTSQEAADLERAYEAFAVDASRARSPFYRLGARLHDKYHPHRSAHEVGDRRPSPDPDAVTP